MTLPGNPEPARDLTERLRLIRDGLVNYSAPLVGSVVGFVLVPIMLHRLGAESYGLWIAANTVAALVGALDLGLGTAVARAVAQRPVQASSPAVPRIYSAAANAYARLGFVGMLIIGALGLAISAGLHLSADRRGDGPVVFALVGVSFFGNTILRFVVSVLHGLRRFDSANVVTIARIVFGAGGIVAFLKMGAGIVLVAAWDGFAALTAATGALLLVARLDPRFRPRIGRLDSELLGAHARFGLASQGATGAIALFWQMPALLVGFIRGSAAIAPYSVGQKLALTATAISWTSADVFFPAASEHESSADSMRAKEVLDVATRWPVVTALPICILVWILAPEFLAVWLGGVPHGSVVVARVFAATVLVDALGLGPSQVLWGRGRAGTVLAVFAPVAAVSIAITAAFLPVIGLSAAAWGMFGPLAVGSVALLVLASHELGLNPFAQFRATVRGLTWPTIACLGIGAALSHGLSFGGWTEVLSTAIPAGCAYVIVLYATGARDEEQMLIRFALKSPLVPGRLLYSRTTRRIRRIRSRRNP
jgi:O-antigen/teichoic acid export membrane protein